MTASRVPRVGPGGELVARPGGTAAVRLTARGRRLAAAYLALYPRPECRMLRNPRTASLYAAARLAVEGGRLEWADVRQAATLGVLDAAARYAPGRGTGFRAYAVYWSAHRVGRLLDRRPAAESLDAPAAADDDRRLGELVPDPRAAEPLAAAARGEVLGAVAAAVAALPRVDRRVVTARFGLAGGGPMRVTLAARTLGLDVGVARGREAHARAELRARLAGVG